MHERFAVQRRKLVRCHLLTDEERVGLDDGAERPGRDERLGDRRSESGKRCQSGFRHGVQIENALTDLRASDDAGEQDGQEDGGGQQRTVLTHG